MIAKQADGVKEVDVLDIVAETAKDVAEYCLPLILLNFCGQTSGANNQVYVFTTTREFLVLSFNPHFIIRFLSYLLPT